jgi:hypothetical protein
MKRVDNLSFSFYTILPMNDQKTFLTPEQVEVFVNTNKYEINQSQWYLSRCIDGRYESEAGLEPLAKPGADIGDLMMMLAANTQYALNLTPEIMLDVLINTVGGKENFRIHTDCHNHHHEDKKEKCLGCGHLKQATLDKDAYGLEKEDIDFIFEALHQLKSNGAKNNVLEGDHLEKAVIILKSQNYSIYPKIKKETGNIKCFVYSKTLDDKRRRLLAQNLLPHIKSDRDINEEYLYEILTTVSDQQLFETVSRLAPEHPIYNVEIDEEGEVVIKE